MSKLSRLHPQLGTSFSAALPARVTEHRAEKNTIIDAYFADINLSMRRIMNIFTANYAEI
jgi:hypothetical protein